MAKWSDITRKDKYKNLSVEDKLTVKRNWALKHIVPNEEFQSLSDIEQTDVLEKFSHISKADGIPKRHIRNLMLAVDNNIRAVPGGSEAELGMAMVDMFGQMVGLADKPVEAAAKGIETLGGKIEGGVPPGRTLAGLVFKDFPRFFAAETLRFYKPSFMLTAAALGPIIGKVGGTAGKAIKASPKAALGVAGAGAGALAGAALDEENRGRGALIGAGVGAGVGVATGAVGAKHSEALKRFFFADRGNPLDFTKAKRVAELERSEGARQAERAGESLFIAQEDVTIQLSPLAAAQKNTRVTLETGKKAIIKKGQQFPEGSTKLIKKGQMLPREQQKALGKAFRKEFELGGKRPELPTTPPKVTATQLQIEETTGIRQQMMSDRINKSIEVNIAFNPKLKGLNKQLKAVNKELRSAESRIEGLVGKKFRTDTGFVEEAVGPGLIPEEKLGQKFNPVTGERYTRPGIETRPIAPKTGNIPNDLLKAGEDVLREISQVSKAKTLVKPLATGRKALLKQRRQILEHMRKESMRVELGARANYSLFDRKFAEQIRGNPKFKQLSKLSQEGRDIMDAWSKELVASGIPTKKAAEIIEANTGEYMARMYEKKLIKDPNFFGNFKSLRLRVNGLRKRKELSEDALRALGIVNEPALGAATRVKEISTSVANNKLFKTVANNPEWSAATNVTGKMVQLPDVKTLGPLKGKWVIKSIADDVNSIVGASRNMALEMYGRGMAAFKFGKVVLNPATHMRNMVTNTMLLDMSGVGQEEQAIMFPQMMKDYIQKGPIYQRALKSGAIGGEFYGGDIKIIQDFYTHNGGNNLGKWLNTMKAPFRAAGKVYQGEEQLAKMVKFKHMIQNGADDALAATEAQKWLFNYTDIPEAIKFAKQVAPFITFTYKAIPRVVETGVTAPLKLYKYYAVFSAFNEAARKTQGMTPTEYAKELDALPPWMMRAIGGFPSVLFMPWKDDAGRTLFMNLEYILPLGMAPDIIERGLGPGGLAQALGAMVGNPYFTTLSDLINNKDFRGQDIVPFGATLAEASHARIQHLYQQLAPSLAPGLPGMKGGYSWEKLLEAINKKKVKFEQDKVKRELTPTMLDILMGIKMTPVDMQRSTIFQMQQKERDVRELERQLFSAMGDMDMSEEDKARMVDRYYKKLQKVIND